MTVYPGDFNAVAAQDYTKDDRISIREFIREHGEEYVSLTDLLTDWRDTQD